MGEEVAVWAYSTMNVYTTKAIWLNLVGLEVVESGQKSAQTISEGQNQALVTRQPHSVAGKRNPNTKHYK